MVKMEDMIRPINYLGSKLRILDEIKKQIDELDPDKGPICDLFAGSGTVSNYLAREREVISIDVQEYSRVICSALLNKIENLKEGNRILDECLVMPEYNELKDIFGALSKYERKCINLAVNDKKNEVLCDFLENASLVSYDNGECESSYDELEDTLKECSAKYRTSSMFGTEGIISYLYGGVYFSFEQTISIDMVICWIKKMQQANKRTNIWRL